MKNTSENTCHYKTVNSIESKAMVINLIFGEIQVEEPTETMEKKQI